MTLSPLLDQFWSFHTEILRLKRAVEREHAPTEGDPSEPGEAGTPPDAAGVSQALARRLERVQRDLGRATGDLGRDSTDQALYAMAALADEIFLHMAEWSDRAAFRAALVELALFKSHVAGERLFDDIDRLLAARDPLKAELATIYLLALGLGFRGRYRDGGEAAEARLARYRRQLYEMVFQQPAGLEEEGARLSPDAYRHVVAEPQAPRHVPLAHWLGLLAIAAVVALVNSHMVWPAGIAPLMAALDALVDAARAIGL